MKKPLLVGLVCFLLGVSISFAPNVYSQIEELRVSYNQFPIYVNGELTDIEAYNINGYTYPKLAEFRKFGLEVIFNESKSQIEINNLIDGERFTTGVFMDKYKSIGTKNDIYLSLADILNNKDGFAAQILQIKDTKEIEKYPITTFDGVPAINVSGKWYIRESELRDIVNSNKAYWDDEKITVSTMDDAFTVSLYYNNEEHCIYNGRMKFYRYNLLYPLIKHTRDNPEIGFIQPQTVNEPVKQPDNNVLEVVTYKKGDIEITKINGIEYIGKTYLSFYIKDKYDRQYSLYTTTKTFLQKNTDKIILLDRIETYSFFDENEERYKLYIKYDYYIENILPLLTKGE